MVSQQFLVEDIVANTSTDGANEKSDGYGKLKPRSSSSSRSQSSAKSARSGANSPRDASSRSKPGGSRSYSRTGSADDRNSTRKRRDGEAAARSANHEDSGSRPKSSRGGSSYSSAKPRESRDARARGNSGYQDSRPARNSRESERGNERTKSSYREDQASRRGDKAAGSSYSSRSNSDSRSYSRTSRDDTRSGSYQASSPRREYSGQDQQSARDSDGRSGSYERRESTDRGSDRRGSDRSASETRGSETRGYAGRGNEGRGYGKPNGDRRGPERGQRGGAKHKGKPVGNTTYDDKDQRTSYRSTAHRVTRAEDHSAAERFPDSLFDELDPMVSEVLSGEVRADLRSLGGGLSARVGVHLTAAALLLEEDEIDEALRHAKEAKRLAPRVGSVREALGVLAYRAGIFELAAAELKAARRISGKDDVVPLLADCARAAGDPQRALSLASQPLHLNDEDKLELRLVAAGARMDMGQPDAAALLLRLPLLASREQSPASARIKYVYAEAMLASGNPAEAAIWFRRALEADVEAVTDAAERLSELPSEVKGTQS